MSDILKDFDAMKILLWIIPGVFISTFRSFSIRGSFPTISKDDIGALIIGSVIYWFCLLSVYTGFDFAHQNLKLQFTGLVGFFALIAIPAASGFLLGLLEVSDCVGKQLRKMGIRFPSPHPTAWETIFREVPNNAVMLVTLKDGTVVYGRWAEGKISSSSSSDPKQTDLFLGEIGTVTANGEYEAKDPQRGAYLAASEIRLIEIIAV